MNTIIKLINGIRPTEDPIIPNDVQTVLDSSSAAFNTVQRVFILVGIVILIVTAKKVIFALMGASGGKESGPLAAGKALVMGLIATIFSFNLKLPLSLVSGLGKVLERVFQAVSGVLG